MPINGRVATLSGKAPVTSLWLDRSGPSFPPLATDARYNVVVMAPVTAWTTALLLARARPAPAWARYPRGRIGRCRYHRQHHPKISLLQGTRLSSIRSTHDASTARQYVEANREGQAWLLHYCAEHEVPYQVRSSYTYATTDKGGRSVHAELEACRESGLPVAQTMDVELPYPITAAVRLDDQAQFDPLDLLTEMVADIVSRGVDVHENSRVRAVRPGRRTEVATDLATLRADRVVLATGIPIMDRGGFFARLEPLRSYAAVFEVPGPVPQGMYLSADSPTRSVRSVPHGGGELLLTGGNGHVVGRKSGTSRLVEDLTRWTRLPGATRTHAWSAQDYHSVHELPYAGPLVPHDDRIMIASGYDKWGMTNAVAAALALSSSLLGGHTEWATVMRSWSGREVKGAVSALRVNASVGLALGTGWIAPLLHSPEKLNPGEGRGRVERGGLAPVAVCTVDGKTVRRSAVCTHLHGVVSWNDAERSWDCPLHGSRFRPDGSVIEGPATEDLPPA